MPFANASPITFRARGVSDGVDGSGTFQGAMKSLQNLVPDPRQAGIVVPRSAAVQLSNFAGFNTPAAVSAMLVVGDLVYGMVATARNAGKDEPFIYDLSAGAFVTIGNVTNANTPTSPLTTGDWTPPTMAMTTGGRVMITHPGYDAVNTFVGWIDVSSFSDATVTGTTHTSTLIDTLSANPINQGWQVGYRVTGAGIPANTFIKSMTAASITLTQATTAGAAGVALTVTGGTPAAPLYGAGNTNSFAFTALPSCVALFNTRAWYGLGNFVVFSDTLNPTQISSASQALRIGDNTPVTALAGLPLTSQVQGGTLQSLIAFKGPQSYAQITGDAATSNLSSNVVPGSVGTRAPNTLCATPLGVAMMAIDGLRIIGLDGVQRPVIGANGEGINWPLQQAVNPSRAAGAYHDSTYRVTVQNPDLAGDQHQEWWYDFNLQTWTGPHTSASTMIEAYLGTVTGVGEFIQALNGVSGKLFTSSAKPRIDATYTENGTGLAWVWQTLLTQDNGQAAMNNLCPQSTLSCQLPTGAAISVLLSNENSMQLDSALIEGPVMAGATWGSSTWGSATWGYSVQPFQQVSIDWTQPQVFKQASIQMNGSSLGGLRIGDLHAEVQTLGYMIP
jgi:hypothetical protein